jgi:anti-anti-sigma factor
MTRRAIDQRGATRILPWPGTNRFSVVYVTGPLQVPLDGDLRRSVRALLRRGGRLIVVDMTGVSRIDAAGVGELVRAYNLIRTANGVLRIAHASAWVRRILQLVGLFDLFSGNSDQGHPSRVAL